MRPREDKLDRLVHAARRYYLDDWKQSDIAREMGISRPLVSRMLQEARDLGVVEITIHAPGGGEGSLTDRLCRRWPLRDVELAAPGGDDSQTNESLALRAAELVDRLGARRVGIGWGHFVGQLVACLERQPRLDSPVEAVCPLLGSAGVPIRNYQSNENARLMAERLGAEPYFINLPALAESWEEKELLCSTELYRQAYSRWEGLDTALVNIGNYPSTPDFASVARYGDKLHQQHACGRLLNYYFNEAGEIISSDHDFAIQIPLALLTRCPRVIGLCSANTAPRALLGALRTGLFTGLVAGEDLVRAVVDGAGPEPAREE